MSDVILVTESLRRCYASKTFYDEFFGSLARRVPEAVKLFDGATEIVLKNFLRNALTLILMDAAGSPHATAKLKQVHQRHGPDDLNLNPAWFPEWTASVLEAVAKSDPETSSSLLAAWERVLTPSVKKVTP
jgi:hypothetical protein